MLLTSWFSEVQIEALAHQLWGNPHMFLNDFDFPTLHRFLWPIQSQRLPTNKTSAFWQGRRAKVVSSLNSLKAPWCEILNISRELWQKWGGMGSSFPRTVGWARGHWGFLGAVLGVPWGAYRSLGGPGSPGASMRGFFELVILGVVFWLYTEILTFYIFICC